MLKNLNEMQKKLVKFMIIGIALLALLFIIMWLISLVKGGKLSYDKIENKMVKAAESYYKANQDMLPKGETSKVELNVSVLAEKGYMKELNDYTDATCTGKVKVLKNGDNYAYIPQLSCGEEYNSKNLVETIIDSNNIVTESDGLYEINGEYVYRGEKLNNYVSFAGKLWRIIKVTNNNEIRMIQNDSFDKVDWDNRYNSDKKSDIGINEFNVSRIEEDLENLYNGEIFKETDKAKLIPKQLCIGKRKTNDTSKDGSTECSVVTEKHYPIGLLQVNEYLISSLDEGCTDSTKRQCTNYNFLANFNTNYWTLTASTDNTYDVFYIDRLPQTVNSRKLSSIKLVINVSGEINYKKGTGTLENPYVID